MNEKITLQDLVELLSEKNGMTKKSADALFRGMFELIEEALTNEKYVKVKGLGTFKLTEVDSRESMNVNTGERIEIQGHTKISFTPDTAMKELINKPFSHFETVVLNDGVELEDTPIYEESKMEELAGEMVEKVIDQPQTEVEAVAEVQMEISEETIVSPVVEEPEIAEPKVGETLVEENVPESVVKEETVEEPKVAEPVVELEAPTEAGEKAEPILEEISEIVSKPEEIVEEKPIIVEPEVSRSESKTTFRVLIGIIIVLLLIILFGLYWIFIRQGSSSSASIPSVPVKEEATIVQVEEQQEVKKDTSSVEVSDEKMSMATLATQPGPVEQIAVLSEDVVYEITGTITTLTLEPGQTLVKLALKYYGSKNFWPYIMQHNPDVIKDADMVPKGAVIKIPKLEPKK